MNEMIVPPGPKWFLPNGFLCTPDGGLLYSTNFSAVYIQAIIPDKTPDIKIFPVHGKSKSLACDPDWSEKKYFAVLTESNALLVYEFSSLDPIIGHNAHAGRGTIDGNFDTGTICFASNKRIYSVDRNIFVNYCVLANKYTIDKDFLQLNKNRITIMRSSPKNPDIVAAGTRTGLILIANVQEKNILFSLRGHDTEITSIDWLVAPVTKNPPPKSEPAKKPKKFERELPTNDDIFDIYEFDHLENEFGTIRDTKPLFDESEMENREMIETNEHFDFVEACQTLKEVIMSSVIDELDELEHPAGASNADEIQRLYNLDDERNLSLHGSENPSRDGFDSDDGERSDPELDFKVNETSPDFVLVSDTNIAEETVSYIATAAKELSIWIWNADNGTGIHQIKSKSSKNAQFSPFVNAAWINTSGLITNSPSGEIYEWSLSNFGDGKSMKATAKAKKFNSNSVIAICLNIIGDRLWAFSMDHQRELFCFDLSGDSPKVIANFCTLIPTMNCIAQCSLDLNKIALGCIDKKIGIMNVTNLRDNFIPIQAIMNKIQNKVLSIAWHPAKENLLAFGTAEGQVAIFDTTKLSNPPIRMKPFSGKPVYSISWGNLVDGSGKGQVVLFACSTQSGKLVYYSSGGGGRFEPIDVRHIPNVSEISCCDSILAIGTKCGAIGLYDLDQDMKEIFTMRIFQKYVSSIAWNPINKNMLAIASMEHSIVLIDRTSIETKKTLLGHKSSIACVRWSYNSLNKLVSASYDHTIRVWDTNTLETIALFQGSGLMFAAIFSPADDNFIICGGIKSSIVIFDYRKHPVTDVSESLVDKMLKTSSDKLKVDWATNTSSAKKSRRGQIKAEVDKLAVSIENVKLETDDEVPGPSGVIKKRDRDQSGGRATVCILTNKEMTRNTAELITKILNDDETSTIYHKKLFSTRDEIKEVLSDEFNNIKKSDNLSSVNVSIPLMMGNLKEEIIERTEKKTLTEYHVMLAPYISYDFWRKTCQALAHQYLETGLSLNAISLLIAIHDVNGTIECLCKSFNFREAWIVAKLYKTEDDPIFREIFEKWTTDLSSNGNYLAGALVFACNKDLVGAKNILCKIKNPTEEIINLIELVKSKSE